MKNARTVISRCVRRVRALLPQLTKPEAGEVCRDLAKKRRASEKSRARRGRGRRISGGGS